jgi:hypothetical protein
MGLKWDHFTPQVKDKVMRDVMAIQAQPGGSDLIVYFEPDNEECAALLRALGVKRTPMKTLANLWVIYQTGPDTVEEPEGVAEVVYRDMQIHAKDPNVLDPTGQNGFYLAPQGRNIAPTLDINRPMPGWYPGGPNPAVVYLWGSLTKRWKKPK